MRLFSVLFICLSMAGTILAGEEHRGMPFTPEAGIETSRFMEDRGSGRDLSCDGAVSVAPDRRAYVARVVRGDLKRNGVVMDVLAGGLNSLNSATSIKTVARLFSTGLPSSGSESGADNDTIDLANTLRWIDNENVAFPWSDSRGIRQVVAVNIHTHKVRWLTEHPYPVYAFDINSAGVLIYIAAAQHSRAQSQELIKKGFVVHEESDLFGILSGDVDGYGFVDRAWNSVAFIKFPNEAARPLETVPSLVDPSSRLVSLSPDAQVALVGVSPASTPAGWDQYSDDLARQAVRAATRSRRAPYARLLQETHVVDLRSATSRPLWKALTQGRVTWSPEGRSVLLTGTFLPPGVADDSGLAGTAAAIVDVKTGKSQKVPMTISAIHSARWLSESEVQIDTLEASRQRVTQHRFIKTSGGWRLSVMPSFEPTCSGQIRMELRQDLKTPPKLYAVDLTSKEERLVLDPNPNLLDLFSLGRVELREGVTGTGHKWRGRLIFPSAYKSGTRYPLVIQSSYSGLGTDFNLYGAWASVSGLGPTPISPYPGQALAAVGIMVLQLHSQAEVGPAEAETYRAAFEDAIKQLTHEGLVDEAKVGLIGFSRNGYYVEYALSHSGFPYAAAVAADNFDPSYFQTAVTDWREQAADVIGALPFGEGLNVWLVNAPAFNTHRIRTPLRLVGLSLNSALNVLGAWEMFSRLRFQRKPVEFYLMPDIDQHGGHNTQNPVQILAVQRGVVDWFNFWLNNRRDGDIDKQEQFARWERLRELRDQISSE